MGTFLFWFVIFGVIAFFLFSSENKKDAQKKQLLKEKLDVEVNKVLSKEDIKISRRINGIDNSFVLIFDEDHRKIYYLRPYLDREYNYSDILDVEILNDQTVVYRKTTANVVGRSIVGGLIGGGVGAIIGGATTNGKAKKYVPTYKVKVKTRDINNPSFEIVCFDPLTMTIIKKHEQKLRGQDLIKYNRGLDMANNINEIMGIIIDRNKG